MKAILFSFFISCFTSLHGQIIISNISLTDSSLGYLYIGVDNEIKITGVVDNYVVRISGGAGTIQKIEKSRYIARVAAQTDTCKIILLKETKVIFKKEYKVRIISEPIATINGLRDTSMKVNTLLVNPFISVRLPGCFFRSNYIIYSFQATFIQDVDSTVTSANGSSFSIEQLKLAKNLKPGNRIFFDNIRAGGPDSRIVKLAPFWINIE